MWQVSAQRRSKVLAWKAGSWACVLLLLLACSGTGRGAKPRATPEPADVVVELARPFPPVPAPVASEQPPGPEPVEATAGDPSASVAEEVPGAAPQAALVADPVPAAPPAAPPLPAAATPAPRRFVEPETAGGVDYLLVRRGEGRQPIAILPGEELAYDVEIDVGVGELDVGDVRLVSGREELLSSLPDARADSPATDRLESAWVRSVASGGYMGYHVVHTLETRFLPEQQWPRILHKDEQRGSENRNRELRLGFLDSGSSGALHSLQYRSDGHCSKCENKEHYVEGTFVWQKPEHCKKCKKLEHRVWRAPLVDTAPEDALDMLGAVWIARSLVAGRKESADFTIVDRQRLWGVTAAVGERKDVEVPAGVYRSRRVSLSTRLLRGNPDDKANTNFQGLFGIQGTLKIWMEEATGTPVLIEGDLPIPVPLVDSLRVRVKLKSAKGVDPRFKKLR